MGQNIIIVVIRIVVLPLELILNLEITVTMDLCSSKKFQKATSKHGQKITVNKYYDAVAPGWGDYPIAIGINKI